MLPFKIIPWPPSYWSVPKKTVYTNSLLATLNARKMIRIAGEGIQTTSENLSVSLREFPKNGPMMVNYSFFIYFILFLFRFLTRLWINRVLLTNPQFYHLLSLSLCLSLSLSLFFHSDQPISQSKLIQLKNSLVILIQNSILVDNPRWACWPGVLPPSFFIYYEC